MTKDLKPSLRREQRQHQPTAKSSQAFLRPLCRLRPDRLQQAVSETRHLCRVLLRKSLVILTSRTCQYLHLTSPVLLPRARHHRPCLKPSHALHHHQHPRISHRPTPFIALHSRKLRNRSPLHIAVHSLAGVLRKTSGLLPNQTRTTRATREKMLPLADRPSIWHQSCSVQWLRLDHYPQWTVNLQRQCRTCQ